MVGDMKNYIFVVFIALFLYGCSKVEVTDQQAISIANNYVNQHYPMMPMNILRPEARDNGRTWIVTYAVPEDSTGFTPVIEIHKNDGRVVNARAE
jgi:hypothetical protein